MPGPADASPTPHGPASPAHRAAAAPVPLASPQAALVPARPAPLAPPAPAALALWGGAECSVVRLGDEWRDQARESGHHDRFDDLARIASLGIRTVRAAVLWERCAPGPAHCGWTWHDARMAEMRRLGLAPIVGLMHHGSGPPGTDLLDPALPEALAAHAARVAERYPWVADWTPVNEPLTTARFSGLYRIWHPHADDEALFLRMVATVLLSMRAIRARVPAARLVQTEDLGRVFATAPLAARAARENERRWLSLDLLCGRVDAHHPWHERFLRAGTPPGWLAAFLGREAAPDLVGINHYVTSDRFLDHRTGRYPPRVRTGEPGARYADTEAVRAGVPSADLGWAARLREAWERYGRPLAATEVHLGCAQDAEQVRWLLEAWAAAHEVRAEGVDVRAVTVWALFGAMDWDSLLRQRRGRYEPGAFDVRAAPPRLTLLGEAARALATHGRFAHPCLGEPGWWHRPDRLHPRCVPPPAAPPA